MNSGSYHKISLTCVTTAYQARKLQLMVNHKNLSKRAFLSVYSKNIQLPVLHGKGSYHPKMPVSLPFSLSDPTFGLYNPFCTLLCSVNSCPHNRAVEIAFRVSQYNGK